MTTDIKRVFWKDYCVCQSYGAAQSLLPVNKGKQIVGLAASKLRRSSLKTVVKTAAHNLLATSILSSLRGHMALSVAVGVSSAAPGVALGRGEVVARASTAARAAARYSAEYALWGALKRQAASKLHLRKGSAEDAVVSFAAGVAATAVCEGALAFGGARLRLGRLALQKLAFRSVGSGLGYCAMDRTFEALYLSPAAAAPLAEALPAAPAVVSTTSAATAPLSLARPVDMPLRVVPRLQLQCAPSARRAARPLRGQRVHPPSAIHHQHALVLRC